VYLSALIHKHLEMTMPKVSSKRQVTLPVAACNALDIHPGDDIEIFTYKNQFNIIKKNPGAAAGILKNIKANQSITEQESLISNFE